MKVKCIYNSGEAFRGYKMPIGYFETSIFGVEVGKEYFVMGILTSERLVCYLVDEGGVPQFYPFQLFTIRDSKIPDGWYFKANTLDSNTYRFQHTIMGYYQLLHENDHYNKLIDLDVDSLAIYFKWKVEFEKEMTG